LTPKRTARQARRDEDRPPVDSHTAPDRRGPATAFGRCDATRTSQELQRRSQHDFVVQAVNHLDAIDPDTVIWRYLTFAKFSKLVSLRALWFAKLGIFEDIEEGMTPDIARQQLKAQHRDMETWFPDEERRSQVRRFVEDNERFGRDLIVASCWFIGDSESRRMWDEYSNESTGVAIRSTVGALERALTQALPEKWWIGRVKYIDRASYEGMNAYTGSQAHERAFLKSPSFAHESELRVATMNFVMPGCLNPDGLPQSDNQQRGLIDVSDGPGVYVLAQLNGLIAEARAAPGAEPSHVLTIRDMLKSAGCHMPVRPSDFS
jgi:hypothetical protein